MTTRGSFATWTRSKPMSWRAPMRGYRTHQGGHENPSAWLWRAVAGNARHQTTSEGKR